MLSTITPVVAALLTKYFTETVRVEFVETVWDYDNARSAIHRFRVIGGHGLLSTVIVKQSKDKHGTLRREAAGLDFVQQIDGIRHFFPTFYGFSADHELLVMGDLQTRDEDLLGNILFGEDAELAVDALLAYQKAIAQVHTLTRAEQARFQDCLVRYNVTQHTAHRINGLTHDLQQIRTRLALINLRPPSAFDVEIAQMIAQLENPSEFLCFTHGDMTPSNMIYRDGVVQLYDLETADFRHALLDGSFGVLRYIHSVWAQRIPYTIQYQMLNTYSQTWLKSTQNFVEHEKFNQALMTGCSAWLAGLIGMLEDVWEVDKRWGRSTRRQRIMVALEHYLHLVAKMPIYPAFTASVTALQSVLVSEWSTTHPMETFPALRDIE